MDYNTVDQEYRITWTVLVSEGYGSNFDQVGFEVETQVQMSRMELEVRSGLKIWKLSIDYIFSFEDNTQSLQSKAVITQLCSVSMIWFSFLLFSITIATLIFQRLVFKVRDPQMSLAFIRVL